MFLKNNSKFDLTYVFVVWIDLFMDLKPFFIVGLNFVVLIDLKMLYKKILLTLSKIYIVIKILIEKKTALRLGIGNLRGPFPFL